MSKKNIGIIGLGLMGKPMAITLVKNGFETWGYDYRTEPIEDLQKFGVKPAANPAELGLHCDVIIIMVFDYKQTKQVLCGNRGVFSTIKSGSTIIITNTISPSEVEEIAEIAQEKYVHVIDSPVSGGIKGAEEGTLTMIVGGAATLLEDNRDIFNALGAKIYHVGEKVGSGQMVKAINQMLNYINAVATAEALTLGSKACVDLNALYDVVTHGTGNSSTFMKLAPRMIKQEFPKYSELKVFMKDTAIVQSIGKDLEFPMFMAGTVYQIGLLAKSWGLENEDVACIVKVYEKFLGRPITVRKNKVK